MLVTRRNLFKLGVGASQIALLERFGLDATSPRLARAQAKGPTKLLTIYVPGGWMSSYLWCPLSAAEIGRVIPPVTDTSNSPVYYTAAQVKNLDGSGDMPADDARFARLRTAHQWDTASPGSTAAGPSGHGPYSPNCFAWSNYKLWENVSVVHGIDQGTAAHESGKISAMCGVAGGEYRAPAIHAVVANALYDRYAESRPLPCVSIGSGAVPNPLGLPALASPTVVDSIASLNYTLATGGSDGKAFYAWSGLRELLKSNPQLDFSGAAIEDLATTPIDEHVLRATRALAGKSTKGTDAFYQQLYDGYQGVSKVLARNVVDALAATPGTTYLKGAGAPTYYGSDPGPYAVWSASKNTSGGEWDDSFDLTLKLLKSDLTSAISLYCPGMNNFYFDTHGDAHPAQYAAVRYQGEIIGRLLAEMKNTPASAGGSLLDDTLVLIMSEFARTWPGGHSCDHWPICSVGFAGGGIVPNRMIGGFATDAADAGSIGFLGKSVDFIEEGGQPGNRPPRSGDVIHTALHVLGIQKFFIPGGSGEVVGIRN